MIEEDLAGGKSMIVPDIGDLGRNPMVIAPGSIIRNLDIRRPLPAIPVAGSCTASVPLRSHLCVLDMTLFAPGKPGGGGVGFALGTRTRVRCTLSPGGISPTNVGISKEENDYVSINDTINLVIRSRKPELAHHFTSVLLSVTDAVSHVPGWTILIEVDDPITSHIGLGSNASCITALMAALNHLLGNPLSTSDIRRLIAHNFVESDKNQEGKRVLLTGFETGIAPFVNLHGGLVVMAHGLVPLLRMPLVNSNGRPSRCIVVIPGIAGMAVSEGSSNEANSGASEAELLLNRAASLDGKHSGDKARIVLEDMIPAMNNGDQMKVGNSIGRLQSAGSKQAEIDHSGGDTIRGVINTLAPICSIVGMSSVGPAITGVLREDVDDAEAVRVLSGHGASELLFMDCDNTGLQIENNAG